MTRVGVLYRGGFSHWIETAPAEVQCIEVTAEDFYKGGRGRLGLLRQHCPLLVTTLRLSLGTPGPLDRDELRWFSALVLEAKPLWISERLGFRCTPEIDLAASVPVPLTSDTLRLLVDHARAAVDACGTPLLLENIASCLSIPGTLAEPEFLNRFCEQAGCGVLLDVTALLVNGRNHGFDPLRWLAELDVSHVVQMRVGGCREEAGRWEATHDAPLDEDVLGLVRVVLKRSPVQAVVLERDSRFPPTPEIVADLRRLHALCAVAPGPVHAGRGP